jgi:seryl-tRNA synthetase
MLDINFIRENLDRVRKAIVWKKKSIDIDMLLSLDDKRKKIQAALDQLKFDQKKAGEARDIDLAKSLKDQISSLSKEYDDVMSEYSMMMLQVPQVLHESVPAGKDDSENRELKRVGEVRDFNFELKDHLSLMELHDMIDIERGVKLSWARSYFLKNDGALLEQAVLQYAYQKMIKKWFTPMSVPYMVDPSCLVGTGYFPWGEEDAYCMERDDKWLIATAEIPLTAYHRDEILEWSELPKTYVWLSPCFRREAGTYGKDTRGLYRVHQFHKVEQVLILPADEETTIKRYYQILENAEEILKDLWLPYRLLQLCTWDMALGKYLSHDIECRMPSRNAYGETHSATAFLDFQARRLNIRYRDTDGTIKTCYTMNNTVIACPRFLIALIENNQQADGSIVIPEVLRPYMGKDVIKKL